MTLKKFKNVMSNSLFLKNHKPLSVPPFNRVSIEQKVE